MATPISEKRSIFDDWRKRQELIEQESPVLATRWRVSEIVPAHDDDDGRYVSPRTLNTWLYETYTDAKHFVDTHEPEKFWGVTAEFYITEEHLREFHHKRWVSY